MERTTIDFMKISQALQSTMTTLSYSEEGADLLAFSNLMDAKRELTQAYEFQLLRENREYD
ncbi:hypothetical protein [Bacillus seohaeanensis]|uniref:DUF1657 domain-containing protein n=1 Tax=Bacillus seohaeanensis TaxID=284580 RepID=A0ABW5RRL5_9BACI